MNTSKSIVISDIALGDPMDQLANLKYYVSTATGKSIHVYDIDHHAIIYDKVMNRFEINTYLLSAYEPLITILRNNRSFYIKNNTTQCIAECRAKDELVRDQDTNGMHSVIWQVRYVEALPPSYKAINYDMIIRLDKAHPNTSRIVDNL